MSSTERTKPITTPSGMIGGFTVIRGGPFGFSDFAKQGHFDIAWPTLVTISRGNDSDVINKVCVIVIYGSNRID
jgi:hypothetical protein